MEKIKEVFEKRRIDKYFTMAREIFIQRQKCHNILQPVICSPCSLSTLQLAEFRIYLNYP